MNNSTLHYIISILNKQNLLTTTYYIANEHNIMNDLIQDINTAAATDYSNIKISLNSNIF